MAPRKGTVKPVPMDELADGERWHEGELLEGFSFDDDGYVIDEDGNRTGARRKPLEAALQSLGDAIGATDDEPLDLTERAHLTALDRMEDMATAAVLGDKSLVWDVRDFLMDQIKARPKPWSATSEGEQHDVYAAAEHAATELVRKIVETIAAAGRQPVRVLLTKVTLGDDIVIAGKVKVVEASEEETAVALLHHARGKHVMLTVATAEDYKQGHRESDVDADEPGLNFEAGTDDPD